MADFEVLFAQIKILTDRQQRAIRLVTNGFPQMGRTILQLVHAHGSLSVPQIARLAATSRQNIQTWVNRLKIEGYLDLASNPAHKKSDLVRLTEKGRVLQANLAKQEAKLLERLSSEVSQGEVLPAVALLRRVGQLLAEGESLHRGAIESRTTESATKKDRKPARQRKGVSGIPGRKQARSPVVAPEEIPSIEDEFPLNLL